MPERRPLQNSAWGCSIGGRVLAFFAVLLLVSGSIGCTAPPQASGNIAFMGDSITALWFLPKSNLGISGNTTTQMLGRFSPDISAHAYKAVVILGGTNDVRVVGHPIQEEVNTASSNIEQMAALAEKQNLAVVLCAIPPIRGLDYRVVPLNTAIESIAQKHQYKYVDYYTPMVGHPEYFRDGEHPNDQGYFVMQATLEKVLPLSY